MPFSSVEEFERTESPTDAELALIAACRSGFPCTLPLGTDTGTAILPPAAPATQDSQIRAALLRLLILGGTPACGLHPSGIWLEGAYITGTLDLRFAKAHGQCTLAKCRFDEEPLFVQAHFTQLSLDGSHLPGLFAQGITVDGSVFLRDLTASSTIDINGASIGGQLNCCHATLDGGKDPSGKQQTALLAQNAQVGEDLFLTDLTAAGTLHLSGAKITGQIDFASASLSGGKDANGNQQKALNAQRLHVTQGFFFRELKLVIGQVYLDAAHVGDLADDVASWPMDLDQLYLNGFTYDRIGGTPMSSAERRNWLANGSRFDGTFHPQPYTQFARVLREAGHSSEARKVLMQRQKSAASYARADRRAQSTVGAPSFFRRSTASIVNGFAYVWDTLARQLIGYGYQPWKALVWLTALWFTASFTAQNTWNESSFAPNSDVILVSSGWAEAAAKDCTPKDSALPDCDPNPANTWSNDPARGLDWDSFNAYGYAADLVVPILDLGQTSAWAPSKDRGHWGYGLWWGRWIFEIVGWSLTALGIAAVTGFVQKNQPD